VISFGINGRIIGRHVARLAEWATSNGHVIGGVVTEVGSGTDGTRGDVAQDSVGPVWFDRGRGAQ
jgi:hypothetical protein